MQCRDHNRIAVAEDADPASDFKTKNPKRSFTHAIRKITFLCAEFCPTPHSSLCNDRQLGVAHSSLAYIQSGDT